MSKLTEGLILLLLGGLITYFVTRKEDDGDIVQLQGQVNTLLHEADSLHSLQMAFAVRDTVLTKIHKQDSLEVIKAKDEANQWRINYGKIIHAPVVHYTVPQLDSTVNALIASRHH